MTTVSQIKNSKFVLPKRASHTRHYKKQRMESAGITRKTCLLLRKIPLINKLHKSASKSTAPEPRREKTNESKGTPRLDQMWSPLFLMGGGLTVLIGALLGVQFPGILSIQPELDDTNNNIVLNDNELDELAKFLGKGKSGLPAPVFYKPDGKVLEQADQKTISIGNNKQIIVHFNRDGEYSKFDIPSGLNQEELNQFAEALGKGKSGLPAPVFYKPDGKVLEQADQKTISISNNKQVTVHFNRDGEYSKFIIRKVK